ncbi:hypothetical protein ColTof4_03687 [Colletotrichum tofieldiae]|uniref:Uncharacterized protein n=1 Tax=Colletotrichum tofieldiae TaxID=708197 RepID=A0A166LWQ7_9PEZI|nr:hypothetical protein CT0861_13014 [Colletotrichum tofieldiae]GKT65546.1 hypothetical protein ColTof3_12885 [Colletotrichum tofieldiae]GKT71264.1 hypothetical protein ColTof4_03687 [Colletotrichum tofieldiae]GKT93817.1 hypothetical protein Ct61P_11667 [Colletotrichum tofieldiae]
MGCIKLYGSKSGTAISKVGQPNLMPSTVLAKATSKFKMENSSIGSEPMVPRDTKVAVASYSIQRRVIEAVHDALQASLREEHIMDLKRFKRSLRDQAFNTRAKRHMVFKQKQCTNNCFAFDTPTSCGEDFLSACTFVHQKLVIAKFMVLQAKERSKAAKEYNYQLDGLKQEFGDWIMPLRNGGVREADCTKQRNELLADWGLTNTNTDKSGRGWEDDLRDMVRLSVSKEREERARVRLAASVNVTEKAESISAYNRPRRLSVISESSEEE